MKLLIFLIIICSVLVMCSCSLSKPTTISKITEVWRGKEVVAGTGFNRYWKVFSSLPDSVKIGTTVNVNGWNRYRYSFTK